MQRDHAWKLGLAAAGVAAGIIMVCKLCRTGRKVEAAAYAPGRVELLGNHTDYNEGTVLASALDMGVTVRARATASDTITISSAAKEGVVRVSVNRLERQEGDGAWANYVIGVAKYLKEAGCPIQGMDVRVTSDLPVGVGVSSSAALEVAAALCFADLHAFHSLSRFELVLLAKRCENEFVGVGCGLLDQATVAFGEEDHLVYLDCRSETVDLVHMPSSIMFVIVNPKSPHQLVDGAYNDRRAACMGAAEALCVPALRDVSVQQLENRRDDCDDVVYRRAMHVVGEMDRVERGCRFLMAGDCAAFGQLMFESHRSSMTNFENSTPVLDGIVDVARKTPGVLGARLTGGGFGGCVVMMVEKENFQRVLEDFGKAYVAATGRDMPDFYAAPVGGGAHVL